MRKHGILILCMNLLLRFAAFSQTQADGRILYRNLALSAVVTVSSTGETGLKGEMAADGDTLTRWGSAYKDNEWIMADLKKTYPIDKIILKWEVAFASAYSIQTSEDGNRWTDVFTEIKGNGKTDIIILSSHPARYVRIHCTTRATQFGFSLWEMEIFSFQYPVSFRDAFENTRLTGWSNTENYRLEEEENTLRIERTPSASGKVRGNFSVTLPCPLPAHEFPFLSFKSKAGKNLRLILQLETLDGLKKTVTCSLVSDDRWHIRSFRLDSALHEPVQKLSLQLIAASMDEESIILFLDDLTIGYQDKVQETNKTLLEKLTGKAEAYFRSSLPQAGYRQFIPGAREQYQTNIKAASEILNAPDLAQIEIDKAVGRLIAANVAIEASVIKTPLPLKTCNSNATLETQYLYNNMKIMEGRHIFFGQMDPFYLNLEPSGRPFQSEVEDICGALPAVGSWELKDIATGIPGPSVCKEVEYYYSKNGIVSFCWHMMDPTGTGFYLKDLSDTHAGNELLPGGKYHAWFLEQLDRIAFFFQQLKGPGGESVPVLFRPFHEMDGDWFWWGKPNVPAETFSQLWQFTYHYLVKEKQLNQLLFVFSPCDRFKTRNGELGYLDYYPGDAWVDILAQDNYWQVRTGADSIAFLNQMKIMTSLAAEKNKISGLSETGQAGLTIPDWFTSVLLKPLKNDSLARQITYICLWNRNFVPFPGHPAAPDFLKFYHDPVTLFIGDYRDLYHTLIIPYYLNYESFFNEEMSFSDSGCDPL